jgi:hypothetical protein
LFGFSSSKGFALKFVRVELHVVFLGPVVDSSQVLLK